MDFEKNEDVKQEVQVMKKSLEEVKRNIVNLGKNEDVRQEVQVVKKDFEDFKVSYAQVLKGEVGGEGY